MKVLVTGAAGFIGAGVSQYLLARGDEVVGLDCLNAYYDVSLKRARLERNCAFESYHDVRLDLLDQEGLEDLFRQHEIEGVVNLAAQAGVRYSIDHPHVAVQSNVVGFSHVLEICRHHDVKHLVYASSSSVYGANTTMPFSVHHNVDHPLSMYAATKKANELMAHTYSHLYNMPTTGLRFFTVYGPWGRPDMALFLFTKNILAGLPIDVYNQGKHKRSFTYIDDIVEGVVRVLDHVPTPNADWSGADPDPASSQAPYRIYNIGSSEQEELLRYIEVIEDCLGMKAKKNLLPMQPGDVPETLADVSALEQDVGYRPTTPIETGVKRFIDWYRDYYKV